MQLSFYDVNNLHDVLLTHSTAPRQPSALLSVSRSTLLYLDSDMELRQLDCR